MNDTCTCGHPWRDHYDRKPIGRYCVGTNDCLCEEFYEANAKLQMAKDRYVANHTYEEVEQKPKLKMQLILLGESSLYVNVEEVDARFHRGAQYFAATNFWIARTDDTNYLGSSLRLGTNGGRLENAGDFPSASDRTAWIERMEIALKEWSENWEWFKTCSPSCTNHCPPPKPARVEKEEWTMKAMAVRSDSSQITDMPDRIKVIHYTVY